MITRFICMGGSLSKAPEQLVIGETYSVGRSSKCAFVLLERSVSRLHAELEVRAETLYVKDLKSRNGTFVEGERIAEAKLAAGQKVHFGAVRFKLITGDVPIEDEDDVSHASTFIVDDRNSPIAKREADLTDAQRRVLQQLKKGLREKQVATRLVLSAHTVHNHIKAIYSKFQVKSRPELLALFMADKHEA